MGTTTLPPSVKQLGCEADHSSPPSAKVKNSEVVLPLTHMSSWHGAYSRTEKTFTECFKQLIAKGDAYIIFYTFFGMSFGTTVTPGLPRTSSKLRGTLILGK
jgi:hypothetical protein